MGSPQTIAEAMDLVNALPAPVTVACFVESLDRPLAINATTSAFSAQISPETRSPRIFIFSGTLIMSIALDEPGRELLEFAQETSEGRSLKGELITPVALPADEFLPYDHLRYNEAITSCGVCHRDE
ncbi:MAG: hypothetical protein KC431_18555, partial [Myxococcales bacterium]|nr:hypothetical protein [Myxococcales bacterium]